MFGECHMHIAMDGVSYQQAMQRHVHAPDETHIRASFKRYQEAGVSFMRDGGDKYGVSRRAAHLASEYGIDYRTPIFAIHEKGGYGSIVGRSFQTLREYAQLVNEAAEQGADFIKIMTTGIMDFKEFGRITHHDTNASTVREMVHIAHEHGFAVMSHTNGKRAILAAIEAGVDSIEHGNYIDDECITALKQSRACFIPTATVARNLIGSGIGDDDVLVRIWEASRQATARAVHAGCLVALGSDAGAVGVPHGQGTHDEYSCFSEAIPDAALRDACLQRGEAFIRETFRRR